MMPNDPRASLLLRSAVLLWAAAVFHTVPVLSQALEYPEARRVDHVDTYHGVEVNDPYRWMEDLASDELHDWMAKQDDLTSRFLRDTSLVQHLQQRIDAASTYAAQSPPVQRDERTFFTRREAGETYGTLYVRDADHHTPRELLDLEALNREGRSAFIGSYSANGRFVTYLTSENQSRWTEAHILRVADAEPMPETLTGFYRGGSNAAWTHDGEGFFYTRYPVPDDPQAPLGTPEVYYHRVGTSQDEDTFVYAHPDNPALAFSLRVPHEGRYLIISASEDGGSFNGLFTHLFYKDLRERDGAVTELFAGMDARVAFEGHDGTRFWIRTTHEAPHIRLVEVDLATPAPAQWTELIPASDDVMQAVSTVGDRFVVQYVRDARELLRIYDFEGRLQHEIDQLVPSLNGLADDRDHHVTYYRVFQLYDPGAIYRLDVHTGTTTLHFRPELDHNPDDFVLNQVFYTSKDGTRVPMFLVHKKGLARDGSHPVFMYGYGAWSWSAFPWQRHMVPWMELGGVYAVPNIRGGGEYGEAWHEAGMRRNKQNGIDDFIAAAEWLIDSGYTSPARLVANGGSASGILPAAGIIQRPDLFGAAVINFPALDMLRYTEFGSAQSWIADFGDPSQPEDFEALYAYSPYHNLDDGQCYPPTWVQVGEKDNTTTPMHGYKFAAAMQDAQGCDEPVLLKIAWGAGHSYGLSPEQRYRTQAEELAFLAKVLGLDVPGAFSATPRD